MLVFHEGNAALKDMTCAKNVKFIDLGENGLAKSVVNQVVGGVSGEESRGDLTTLLSDVILHIPRYLVEIKPLSGLIFKEFLASYTHWTYTDPDIVWGNLTDWIEVSDLQKYQVITVSKIFDAGRLFIRGQVRKPTVNYDIITISVS